MTKENLLQTIENHLNTILETMPGYFLVQVRIKPTNNIKVFLDGDEGITIETCIKINRKLYHILEEEQIFPDGDFSLEISSPGVGEPLLSYRQYLKNKGRWVLVKLSDDSAIDGQMKEVNEEGILVETITGKGKKQEIKETAISFDQIKSTSVQIKI